MMRIYCGVFHSLRKMIIKIKSSLGFSAYNKAREGAYASTSHVVDLPAKKYTEANHKFEYKEIGKKFNWTDRLLWSDQDWIKYINE